jgi:ectoine hydroxylase-related dioxygenase (phytanoyl-CoA dioxygenase family)
MLDPARLTEVRGAFSAAIDVMRQRGLCVFDPRLDPNPHNIRVNNLPDVDPVFMELLHDPEALAIARAMLGESALVSNFSANVSLPGAEPMTVHSDQALIVPSPWSQPWVMNVIWCLDDVRKENGGTLYVPGSHKFTTLEDVPENVEAALVPFEASAGSVIVMEGRLWHTSGANVTMDESRALLFALYSRDFVRQQMNWEALLTDATKQRLDEADRALLGLGPLGNVHGVDIIMRDGYDITSVKVL